jgi:hypothetical protein
MGHLSITTDFFINNLEDALEDALEEGKRKEERASSTKVEGSAAAPWPQ